MGQLPKNRRQRTTPWIGWGALDSNHHGPGGTVLRLTWLICYLDNGLMPPPRFSWGIRLWVYARSGRCWHVDLGWYSARRYAESDIERARRADLYVDQQKARGEWPPKMPDGGSADYLGAMLGANGLGLTVREVPRADQDLHRRDAGPAVELRHAPAPVGERPAPLRRPAGGETATEQG